MKIFDTESQKLREFTPLEGNKVKMYVCGPTVYDQPHLGHARCYITWDVVSRYLRFKGYDVTYVRNITDVDDKIINKAKATNSTPEEVATKYYQEFQNDMKELNVASPDIEPLATKNIDEMISIIKTLEEKKYAYSVDGDVYFRVSNFLKYGKLGKQNLEDLKAGARIETSEKKEDPLDFALWKAVKDESELCWDSPWGKGRPGWHIECSAMSKKYLGETIDIHAGGQDLVFPHHENEKAQSEAAFGKSFVKYWMHNGFVRINHEKMSKSLNNFVTIKDLLKSYDANTIRFFILTNQYRMPVEFDDSALKSAQAGMRRIKNAYTDVVETIGEEKIKEAQQVLYPVLEEICKNSHLPFHNIDAEKALEDKLPDSDVFDCVIKYYKKFLNSMDDDFNTSKALATIFDVVSCAQRNRVSENPEKSAFCISLLIKVTDILGFDITSCEKKVEGLEDQLMQVIISVRQTARAQKNWEIADKIRDELGQIGIVLKDHKDRPTTWTIQS